MITFAILAGILICGSIFMVLELLIAPIGHQNESGFNFLDLDNSDGLHLRNHPASTKRLTTQ